MKKIRALAPTHVIVNVDENKKETAEALAEYVPNVIVTHPLGPLDNLALYRLIGNHFNVPARAEMLCARFSSVFDVISKKSFQKRNVLYVIWKDPWMTVSRDTYISRTLAVFGLQTLPESSELRYPKLTDLNVKAVELILLSTEPYRFRERHVKEIRTVTGKPVHLIDGAMTSWYGSRAIQGLRYLADFAVSL